MQTVTGQLKEQSSSFRSRDNRAALFESFYAAAVAAAGAVAVGDTTLSLLSAVHVHRWGAKKVSLMAQWQQVAPFVAVGVLLVLLLVYKFYW
jgi:ABC-type spermidine/putrescine transport system permease subunit II